MDTKTPISHSAEIYKFAGILYERYCQAVGGIAFNGDPLPSWSEFSSDETKTKLASAWVVTAIRAMTHFDGSPIKSSLTFGQALEALKQGKRVAREGWNGKGMFLFLLPASDGIPMSVVHDPALRTVLTTEISKNTFDALGSIRMFTADKKILTGWLASQTDMLSDDWVILN